MLALLIDFNGTISDDKFWSSLPPDELSAVDRVLFRENRALLNDWMRGRVTMRDISTFLADKTGLEASYLFDTLRLSCERMTIDRDIIQVIKNLRSKLRIFLVTGNMDCFRAFAVSANSLYDVFDDIIISSEVKMLKTDRGGGFFEWFEHHYQIPLSSCYLIDDDIKTGLIFSYCGGNYIRVSNPREALAYLRAIDASEFSGPR